LKTSKNTNIITNNPLNTINNINNNKIYATNYNHNKNKLKHVPITDNNVQQITVNKQFKPLNFKLSNDDDMIYLLDLLTTAVFNLKRATSEDGKLDTAETSCKSEKQT